ncbi:unnamed protein product [Gongylonema pulchrum]|uniref:Nop domain-containing protein n=1 Tax=Gongylonema pulchrum TaxID=637853 RepID=A0A183CY45_9BILA|nr:unnamed protein product [Gongylonema pulchrum]
MVVQAVSLLDDLDREINNYIMRCREWYGWHFPELSRIIQDHQSYAKAVRLMGMRTNAQNCDFSGILSKELEDRVKSEAEISMGTDISDSDMYHISGLCTQIIDLAEYRTELADYLKNRMMILAPNLTILLGELVGARLISHAGSLVNLAKYPASTVQILGAEKALFRALKTKRSTPKYGLIYHASLIGQAHSKIKGKVARKLAAKVSLATRIDALADDSQGTATECGVRNRAYIEEFIRKSQEQGPTRITGRATKHEKYTFSSTVKRYEPGVDSTQRSAKKRKFSEVDDEGGEMKKKVEIKEELDDGLDEQPGPSKPKHKKRELEGEQNDQGSSKKKHKKKHDEEQDDQQQQQQQQKSSKKKHKKKKAEVEEE